MLAWKPRLFALLDDLPMAVSLDTTTVAVEFVAVESVAVRVSERRGQW
jgi:hypothetical protein